MHKPKTFFLFSLFLYAQSFLAQSNTELYYKHIHLAEEQLMSEDYEEAFFNYQEAFNLKEGFAIDLINASCAMLGSKPDVNLLCEWN